MRVPCHALPMQRTDPVGRNATYSERIEFVVELARRLHTYGTTAERLEGAVGSVARRLGLRCDPFSNPTGIVLSFADAHAGSKLADVTQMVRLEPGDINLRKLCAADAIAEDVLADRTDIATGSAALAALDRESGWRAKLMGALSYGLSAAAVTGMLRSRWTDIVTAALIGSLIGAGVTKKNPVQFTDGR